MGNPVNDRDDLALRNLFQQHGALEAPTGMDQRILQRLAVLPLPKVDVNAPLLPKWAWVVFATALGGFAAVLLSQPSGGSHPVFGVNLAAILGSKWMLGGILCGAALLGLDHWLGTKRMDPHPRELH